MDISQQILDRATRVAAAAERTRRAGTVVMDAAAVRWRSPAAERFRRQLDGISEDLQRTTGLLDELAGDLRRLAAAVRR